jgi:hypothetical protein
MIPAAMTAPVSWTVVSGQRRLETPYRGELCRDLAVAPSVKRRKILRRKGLAHRGSVQQHFIPHAAKNRLSPIRGRPTLAARGIKRYSFGTNPKEK